MSIASNPQEVVKPRSTAKAVEDLASNSSAQLQPDSATRINTGLDRIVAAYAAERTKRGGEFTINRAEECRDWVSGLFRHVNKVAPKIQTTVTPGGLHLLQEWEAEGYLGQRFDWMLDCLVRLVRDGVNVASLEDFVRKAKPTPKTAPSSSPEDPEPALTDAFGPDGTVRTEYASKKFCLILMVNTDTRLSRLDGRVMVQLLIKYLNMESNTAWPAIDTLARELGADRRSIQRAIRRLTELGWLAVDEGGGKQCTSTYHFPLPPGMVSLAAYPWYERR